MTIIAIMIMIACGENGCIFYARLAGASMMGAVIVMKGVLVLTLVYSPPLTGMIE